MKTGIELIAEERQRQIDVEGYDQEHDSQHHYKEFIDAAASYIYYDKTDFDVRQIWPWDLKYFKIKNKKSSLIKAGALIAAALDIIIQKELENNNIEEQIYNEHINKYNKYNEEKQLENNNNE